MAGARSGRQGSTSSGRFLPAGGTSTSKTWARKTPSTKAPARTFQVPGLVKAPMAE